MLQELLPCKGRRDQTTYKNVPAEKSSVIPTHHFVCSSAPSLLPPNALTTTQVVIAPMGAARLKTIRWPLAALFVSPCFNRTDVNPNAAGALCTMIATKMMKLRLVLEVEDEAPSAIPSAAAWMTSPVVVDRLWDGSGAEDSIKESDSTSRLGEDERWGRPRLSRAM